MCLIAITDEFFGNFQESRKKIQMKDIHLQFFINFPICVPPLRYRSTISIQLKSTIYFKNTYLFWSHWRKGNNLDLHLSFEHSKSQRQRVSVIFHTLKSLQQHYQNLNRPAWIARLISY